MPGEAPGRGLRAEARRGYRQDGDPEFRVFVIERHPLFRVGVSQLLEREPDFMLCGEEAEVYSALNILSEARPDLALVNLSLQDGDGIDVIKRLREHRPGLPILVLSHHDESIFAERVIRAGANGYIMKHACMVRVADAMHRALAGEVVMSDEMAQRVASRTLRGSESGVGSTPYELLSDRELDVFELVGQGMGTRDIASRLFISNKTVETHQANMKRKLDLDDYKQLLRIAISWNAGLDLGVS